METHEPISISCRFKEPLPHENRILGDDQTSDVNLSSHKDQTPEEDRTPDANLSLHEDQTPEEN